MITEMDRINAMIKVGKSALATNTTIAKVIVDNFIQSDVRRLMLIGQRYYNNLNDINHRVIRTVNATTSTEQTPTAPAPKLTMEGDNSKPNNKVSHGYTKELVDQKVNYLLSKAPTITSPNTEYSNELKKLFNRNFHKQLQYVTKECINKGVGWLFVQVRDGKLQFVKMKSEELKPIYDDYGELIMMYHYYKEEVVRGYNIENIPKVDIYTKDGVTRYSYETGTLIEDVTAYDYDENDNPITSYLNVGGKPYNWNRLPFIRFRYNEEEIPFIMLLKSLVDDYDRTISDDSNAIEDTANREIIVFKNLGGARLSDAVNNLRKYNAVKVENDGGVEVHRRTAFTTDTLAHAKQTKQDIFSIGRGVDTASVDRTQLSGVALKFIFSNLDLDCNMLETEFQSSFEDLFYFCSTWLNLTKGVDYSEEEVTVTFNRSAIINESDLIENVSKSMDIISKETAIAKHPWVDDVQKELKDATE